MEVLTWESFFPGIRTQADISFLCWTPTPPNSSDYGDWFLRVAFRLKSLSENELFFQAWTSRRRSHSSSSFRSWTPCQAHQGRGHPRGSGERPSAAAAADHEVWSGLVRMMICWSCRGAVAQPVEPPSKVPVWCNSIVGSIVGIRW